MSVTSERGEEGEEEGKVSFIEQKIHQPRTRTRPSVANHTIDQRQQLEHEADKHRGTMDRPKVHTRQWLTAPFREGKNYDTISG